MIRKRRSHSPAFKARGALEVARGEKTVAELVQQHHAHPNQITTWKKELM
jgi:putative transposase